MNTNDWLTGGGVVAAITFLIGTLKTAFPKAVENREQLLALFLGILAGAVVYLREPAKWGPGWSGWIAALVAGAVAGAASGVSHDKVTNPLKRLFGLGKEEK